MNKLPTPKFNWHYGWNVIVITLIFQSLCVGVHYFCFTLWVVPWSEEFSATRSSIMITAALSQVITGLISPFAGRALDRFPSHILISAGIVIFAGGLLLISVTTALWQIAVIYLVVLPPGAILTSALAAQSLAARWFTKDRGLALSLATLGSSLGGLAMPPLAAVLLEAIGWRGTFAVIGLMVLLLAGPLTWLVLRRRPPAEELPDIEYRDNTTPPRERTFTTAALLKHRDFRTLVLCFVPLAMALSAIQMNFGAYMHDLHISATQTGVLLSELAVLTLLGRVASGRFLDRHDHRLLYWIAVSGVGVGIVIVSLSSTFTALAIGIAFLGIFQAPYLPLYSSIVIDRFGARAFGQVMGLGNTFLGIGAFGSLLAALLHDLTGSYTFAFLLLLLMLLPTMWRMKKLSAPAA